MTLRRQNTGPTEKSVGPVFFSPDCTGLSISPDGNAPNEKVNGHTITTSEP